MDSYLGVDMTKVLFVYFVMLRVKLRVDSS